MKTEISAFPTFTPLHLLQATNIKQEHKAALIPVATGLDGNKEHPPALHTTSMDYEHNPEERPLTQPYLFLNVRLGGNYNQLSD